MEAGLPISVRVTAFDQYDHTLPESVFAVSLTLDANDHGGTLTGTLSRPTVGGAVTFPDLRITRPGHGFVIRATVNAISGGSAPIELPLRLNSISVGNGMACGLAPSGDAYCWGRDQAGGLGDGTSGSNRNRPRLVAGNLSFVEVDAGSGSNVNGIFDGGGCGLTAAGAAYCWGRNDYGQLGNGQTTTSGIPVPVSGQFEFAAIGMGTWHTCGLTRDGEVYCWGDNRIGQLGNDYRVIAGSSVPIRVADTLRYDALFVGDLSTCGRATTGDLYCWGWAAPTFQSGVPTPVKPLLVPGGLVFAQAHPGTSLHMCGVGPSSMGYCWGQDYLDGNNLGTAPPGTDQAAPAVVIGGHQWAYIGAGGSSSCGLRTDSVAMCWGYDYNGEVGQGTPGTGAQAPAVVVGGLKFTQLAVGHGSSCAVTTTGDVYCWGTGLFGERGDATFDPQAASPRKVLTP